jgi:hypothetical protein
MPALQERSRATLAIYRKLHVFEEALHETIEVSCGPRRAQGLNDEAIVYLHCPTRT